MPAWRRTCLAVVDVEGDKVVGQSRVVDRVLGVHPLAEQYHVLGEEIPQLRLVGEPCIEALELYQTTERPTINTLARTRVTRSLDRYLCCGLGIDVVASVLHQYLRLIGRQREAQVGAVDLLLERHGPAIVGDLLQERLGLLVVHLDVIRGRRTEIEQMPRARELLDVAAAASVVLGTRDRGA